MISIIQKFIKEEAASGIILLFVALLALLIANSPLAPFYRQLNVIEFAVNDGLMAIFFLLVGLEIKREILDGELDTLQKASLPLIGALGGMIVPALIYAVINLHQPIGLRGWAIPSATDIAFSLGILSIMRSRIPVTLKVFLTALAIIDDLGAIIIIAIFYTASLSWLALSLALCCLVILFLLNRYGMTNFLPYALVGIVLWFFVLKSGVHATLAGVAVALAYPVRDTKNPNNSPAQVLEARLLPWVSFLILPLFAFMNAGLSFEHMAWQTLLLPIPLGIFLGLFLGKQIGIMSFCWLAIQFKIAKMPRGASWLSFYAVAVICGIGFTMSLFIGGLAFEHHSDYSVLVRLGVLSGSGLSALLGLFIIYLFCPKSKAPSTIGVTS